jgi:hypothetical protein
MTDRTAPPGPDAHLDDLATSAALDGLATGAEQAHLGGCADCRAGVERLRAVQSLVATAPPPDPVRREQSIAVALAAFDEVAPAPPKATPLAPARRAGTRRRRRAADLAPWLGVAAVLLLMVLAVPLLSGLGGNDDGDTAQTASDSSGEAGGAAPEEQATAAPAPPVDVGDLGTLAVGADLRPVADRALGPVADDGGADAAASSGAGDAAEEEAAEEEDAPGALEVSPRTTGVPEDEGVLPEEGDDGAQVAATATPCEGAVRQGLPEAGALLLVGTATVDGAPAAVYGFAAPTSRPTVLLALVVEEGCRTVTYQSYARG